MITITTPDPARLRRLITRRDRMNANLYDAEIHYSEVYGEHRAECSGFGDSWPGAELDLERLDSGLRRMQDRWDRWAKAVDTAGYGPWVFPPDGLRILLTIEGDQVPLVDDEIPF